MAIISLLVKVENISTYTMLIIEGNKCSKEFSVPPRIDYVEGKGNLII